MINSKYESASDYLNLVILSYAYENITESQLNNFYENKYSRYYPYNNYKGGK